MIIIIILYYFSLRHCYVSFHIGLCLIRNSQVEILWFKHGYVGQDARLCLNVHNSKLTVKFQVQLYGFYVQLCLHSFGETWLCMAVHIAMPARILGWYSCIGHLTKLCIIYNTHILDALFMHYEFKAYRV